MTLTTKDKLFLNMSCKLENHTPIFRFIKAKKEWLDSDDWEYLFKHIISLDKQVIKKHLGYYYEILKHLYDSSYSYSVKIEGNVIAIREFIYEIRKDFYKKHNITPS